MAMYLDDNQECGNNQTASICEVQVKYSAQILKVIHSQKAKWVIFNAQQEFRLVEMHHGKKHKQISTNDKCWERVFLIRFYCLFIKNINFCLLSLSFSILQMFENSPQEYTGFYMCPFILHTLTTSSFQNDAVSFSYYSLTDAICH